MGRKGKVANARNTDPSTSHVAASAVEATGTAISQRERCLMAAYDKPGSTAGEIAMVVGLDRHTVSKRLPELRERNLICNGTSRLCQVRDTLMMTWWPLE
jgi:CRP-like cAMP-binding protein